jgi:predicted transglutaminase-like cysteine proteinase
MRKELLITVMAAAFASGAVAGLFVAPADAETPRIMALGAATPAPPGFLAFCARTPDQCGLTGASDAHGQPMSADELGRALYAKYYWSVAFGGHAQPLPPASGATAQSASPRNSSLPPSDRQYDWSAIFGTGQIAAPVPMADIAAGQSAPCPLSAAPRSLTAALILRFDAPLLAIDGIRVRPGPTDLTFTYGDRPGFTITPASYQGARAETAGVALDYGLNQGPAGAAAVLPAANTAEAVAIRDTGEAYDAPPPPQATPEAAGVDAPTDREGYDSPPPAPTALEVTPALIAELDRVNLSVNREIRYVSDRVLYGDEDYWHLALGPGGPGAGDCKDYVLEKRRALIADGVPADDLSIAIVETSWHESHAILLVSTDRGELVLDSLSAWIQPWWKVHYHWVERQAPGQQLSWISIS